MEAKPVVDEGVTESLRSLQSLLDDGVITESEFEEKKRQLLDQPATRAAPPGETPPPPKKIKAAPPAPAAPPAAPPAIQPPGGSNEPSLPLGYYELRDASDEEIGYLALSISKSSGGFFGMMTLTSGEWEVDYGCYSHEDPYETRTLLPVISSGSSSGSGPVSSMGWRCDGDQFLFGLEDAPYDGTLSLRVLRNSGTLAVSWALESHDFDWSHHGEAMAIPTAADEAREAFWMISDTRSVLTGEATREHFNKGRST